jgi:catechol 2,3-dioxygenase-like lactoylglutathione lyase family enzyme
MMREHRDVANPGDGGQRRSIMLERFSPRTTLAVSDLARAKTWYEQKLGLKPTAEFLAGLSYECDGGSFALFPTPNAGTAKNTVMEWTVDDVEEVVTALKGRGVTFDTFEMDGVEWSGEIAMTGGRKAAWFRDSEGNILAITD